jgi:hypothetical protein
VREDRDRPAWKSTPVREDRDRPAWKSTPVREDRDLSTWKSTPVREDRDPSTWNRDLPAWKSTPVREDRELSTWNRDLPTWKRDFRSRGRDWLSNRTAGEGTFHSQRGSETSRFSFPSPRGHRRPLVCSRRTSSYNERSQPGIRLRDRRRKMARICTPAASRGRTRPTPRCCTIRRSSTSRRERTNVRRRVADRPFHIEGDHSRHRGMNQCTLRERRRYRSAIQGRTWRRECTWPKAGRALPDPSQAGRARHTSTRTRIGRSRETDHRALFRWHLGNRR